MSLKSEFMDWKSNHMTKAFFEAAKVRERDAVEILATHAGLSPIEDNFYRGFIQAYREMFDFDVEEAEKELA